MKKILHLFIIICCIYTHVTHAANQKLTVVLDWFANPSHAPLFVAKEKGFFAEQGLDVRLIGPADPADPPKLVAAGHADMAITYQPAFLEQVDRGLPLIRIGTLIDKPLDCIVVLKDSPIKSITDLKGKRIGYSSGGAQNIMLKTMLEKNGLSLKDVQHINVHYDLTQALLSRKVDAVTGVMRTFEVIQMELAKHPARIFTPEDYQIPTYSELIFVVKKEHTHDQRFQRFLLALQKAVLYLEKNPKETWNLFIKNHPELNDSLNQQAWFASLPYFAKHPADFNATEWLNFAKLMHTNGLIKTIQPIDAYAINLLKD